MVPDCVTHQRGSTRPQLVFLVNELLDELGTLGRDLCVSLPRAQRHVDASVSVSASVSREPQQIPPPEAVGMVLRLNADTAVESHSLPNLN